MFTSSNIYNPAPWLSSAPCLSTGLIKLCAGRPVLLVAICSQRSLACPFYTSPCVPRLLIGSGSPRGMPIGVYISTSIIGSFPGCKTQSEPCPGSDLDSFSHNCQCTATSIHRHTHTHLAKRLSNLTWLVTSGPW